MSNIQETDKIMRAVAIIGGLVAVIESILELIGFGLMPYGFFLISGSLAFLFAALAILLGFKPIHYTPAILGILGILLIVFASLIGGLIVFFAAIIGALT